MDEQQITASVNCIVWAVTRLIAAEAFNFGGETADETQTAIDELMEATISRLQLSRD